MLCYRLQQFSCQKKLFRYAHSYIWLHYIYMYIYLISSLQCTAYNALPTIHCLQCTHCLQIYRRSVSRMQWQEQLCTVRIAMTSVRLQHNLVARTLRLNQVFSFLLINFKIIANVKFICFLINKFCQRLLCFCYILFFISNNKDKKVNI